MKKRFGITLFAALGVLGLGAQSAAATFHENVIREVGASLTADYVVLQAYAPGQNHVATTRINTYDGGGSIYKTVQIPTDVTNGANQTTILIAQNNTIPGADFYDNDLDVVNTGGTVCFSADIVSGGVDCVAYTSGPTMFPALPLSPFGSPVSLPGGDLNGSALIRSIDKGCATLLDAADDTNNSAADFTVGTGNPRGTSVTPTEKECPPVVTPPTGTDTKKKCKKKKKGKKKAEFAKKKKKKCKKKKKKK